MNVYMGMEDFVKRTIDQYRADPKFGTQIMEIHVPVKKEVKSAGRQLKVIKYIKELCYMGQSSLSPIFLSVVRASL